MSFKVVGIGEVLWDVFPNGRKLGGAPANFAYHASTLGAQGSVVSRVGDDALGAEMIGLLQELGLPSDCISSDPVHPTGTVTVQLAEDGQPHYTIHTAVAWDHLVADATAITAVAAADAVCFGSLAQRGEVSRAAIRTLLARSRPDALRIFDVNLRQDFYSRDVIEQSLELANVLKLNDAELPVLASLLEMRGSSVKDQLAALGERFGLRLIVFTRGAQGSMLYDGARWSEHRVLPVQVKDTVGAGDSFTAALALGTLAGWDLQTTGDHATALAAYVCSCEGATPPIPEHLRAPFRAGALRAGALAGEEQRS